MSQIIDKAVERLAAKATGRYEGICRFVIKGEGVIVLDQNGVRAAPEDDATAADVSLIASAETFQALLAGKLKPASAFMTGKLKVEGKMAMAMKLGAVFG